MTSVWPAVVPVAIIAAIVVLARYCWPLLRLYAQEPVPIGIPLLTCVLILITPQMTDMLAAIVGGRGESGYDEAWWHPLGFGIGTFMLGFTAWFWMRAALNARAGWRDADTPVKLPWHQLYAARLVLVPILLIGASPLVAAVRGRMSWGDVPWWGVFAAAVACAFLLYLAWERRRIYLANRRGTPRPPGRPLPTRRWRRLFAAAPVGPAAAWASLAIALAGFVLAQAWPHWIDTYLHSAWAALLAMACLIPVATVLVALARDAIEAAVVWLESRLPNHLGSWADPAARARAADLGGLALLLVLPLLGSWVSEQAGWYDIETAGRDGPARPTIAEAAAAFAACHKDEARPPAIVVAIEGGASRSGAWGMSALRMLDAATANRFGAHVFALSGVSGGSLAAVTYAMARAGAPAGVPLFDLPSTRNGMVELARADLIPAVVSRMLTADMLFGVPTRGWALSRSFERNWEWNEGFGFKGTRGAGIQAVQRSAPCQPHLLLNGTDVRTGSRVLTATLAVDPRPGGTEDFPDAIDAVGELGADVTASAAVLNSARFPLLSPPGRLQPQAAGAEASMVVDGGVFEGYGARTARELATALRGGGLKPIVVMIRNDGEHAREYPNGPCVPEGKLPSDRDRILAKQAAAKQAAAERGVWVPEFMTSVLGLNAARGAHGRAELFALQRDFCADGDLFDFDMPSLSNQGNTGVPMNWVLDGRNCAVLLEDARISARNIAQAAALAARLGLREYGGEGGPGRMAMLIKALPDAARCRPGVQLESVLARSG